MEDDEDAISIDHLIGVKCVLNASVWVELRKNPRKNNCIELYPDGSHHCLLVGAVTDLTADGGFIVTLCNRKNDVLSEKAFIIANWLFK